MSARDLVALSACRPPSDARRGRLLPCPRSRCDAPDALELLAGVLRARGAGTSALVGRLRSRLTRARAAHGIGSRRSSRGRDADVPGEPARRSSIRRRCSGCADRVAALDAPGRGHRRVARRDPPARSELAERLGARSGGAPASPSSAGSPAASTPPRTAARSPTGGSTVAVLGCGADVVYPAEHRELRATSRRRGRSSHEFPPGTPPLPHHFPLRNRIISGLSRGGRRRRGGGAQRLAHHGAPSRSSRGAT